MYRYKIIIEYNGILYNGWQKQKKEQFDLFKKEDKGQLALALKKFYDVSKIRSVQGVIEYAILSLTKECTRIFAAGRTDAGVHALGQVGHFDLKKKWCSEKLFTGLNFFLKNKGVIIVNCELVVGKFHARFSAVERGYMYKIAIRPYPLIVDEFRYHWLVKGLNVRLIKECINKLIGWHDFNAFRAAGCQAHSSLIEIKKLLVIVRFTSNDGAVVEKNIFDIQEDFIDNCKVYIYISSRSFLYKLVRNLVGVILNIAQGVRDIKNIDIMMNSKDRKDNVFITAEPYGLYFLYAKY